MRPPRITIPLTPKDYRLQVEEVRIATDDGLKLAAWLLPRPGAPALVLLHGYPAEKADLLPIAASLSPHFAILLVDFRYFGKSEGQVTTLGLRERQDLKRAIDFLAGRGYSRVGAFGFSLGGAVAILTAAEDARIRAVVTYAAFSDLRALGYELYWWLGALKYPLVGLMTVWGRLFLGGDLTQPSPEQAAPRLAIPMLLIHSREDEQIPFSHAERLQRALAKTPRAEFYFLDRHFHGQLPPDFEKRVTEFFLKHLA